MHHTDPVRASDYQRMAQARKAQRSHRHTSRRSDCSVDEEEAGREEEREVHQELLAIEDSVKYSDELKSHQREGKRAQRSLDLDAKANLSTLTKEQSRRTKD